MKEPQKEKEKGGEIGYIRRNKEQRQKTKKETGIEKKCEDKRDSSLEKIHHGKVGDLDCLRV